MNKDDQIFKSWFASHIRVQMSGGKKEITDLKISLKEIIQFLIFRLREKNLRMPVVTLMH